MYNTFHATKAQAHFSQVKVQLSKGSVYYHHLNAYQFTDKYTIHDMKERELKKINI